MSDKSEVSNNEHENPKFVVQASNVWGGHLNAEDERGAESPALWLVTFTDVMALMLTFFVMLYSMSVPKEEEWEQVTSAIDLSFSLFQAPKYTSGPQDTLSIDKLDFSNALNLDYLNILVLEIIQGDNGLKDVVVIPQKKKLILSLPIDLLFEAGQAEVTARGKRALYALGAPLSRIRNRIEISGHADPRPVRGEGVRYANNWELSLGRAVNVASVLENVGYTRSVVVRGLSSGRYDELSADIAEEDRLGYARRVDIVIMKDDGSQRFFTSVK